MFKLSRIIFVSLFIGGCALSPTATAVKATLKEAATKTANDLFDDAIWFLCDAVPIGIVKKRLQGYQRQGRMMMCTDAPVLIL